MKKNLLFLAIITAGLSSCVKDRTGENEKNKEIILKRFTTTEPFEVPIIAGSITRVELDGEIIYEGNLPMTIDIPKKTVITRGESEVHCFYTPSETEIVSGSTKREGMLMFEDLPGGDHDYNDFICEINEHLNVQKVGDEYRIALNGTHFKPQALGNSFTITLQFGYEIRNSITGALITEEILSQDIRTDWFGNGQGFINTVPGGETYPTNNNISVNDSELRVPLDSPIAFNWFIIAQGNKHYTTEAYKFLTGGITYNEVINYSQMPYGLFLISKDKDDFNWPIEKCPIWEAYPKFNSWLAGATDDPFAESVAAKLYK